ncbi:RIO1 family regulatory kinase/ATPase domain-containing protein [Candidatus Methanoperedens nitratireducens]|uniref:non-specific serine/threonine protein kinase n=1 Tax=Candidatus Methanoperedens nitratireducens TaxID=1392998 RepID=A0A284VK16_9EURY|nr:RIO1 family regulatory kinase/ATPase [Candidatus Methanoperedens nitroreducens]SNQ59601.1 RIO-type serine/threonine-protein kinase Rio2 [Candidatus Methanoperedens nitroreducens]
MLESIPDIFLNTTNREFRVLLAIENSMKFYEWVPKEEIADFTGYNQKETDFLLTRLAANKLVQRSNGAYEGYRIYFEAYDLLALNALVSRDSVNAIGEIIGVGKESKVYEVTSGITGRHAIIKFHREGMMSFKKVRIKREHIEERRHLSWLYASRLAAKREFEVLKLLYPQVSVPEPIDHNRHAIVMSVLKGQQLAHARVDEPGWYLDEILKQVTKAYQLGIIHADMSEFNVFVNPEGCEIIDWPQYVAAAHTNAKELLYRDIENILMFFQRKYRIKRDIQGVINNITYA